MSSIVWKKRAKTLFKVAGVSAALVAAFLYLKVGQYKYNLRWLLFESRLCLKRRPREKKKFHMVLPPLRTPQRVGNLCPALLQNHRVSSGRSSLESFSQKAKGWRGSQTSWPPEKLARMASLILGALENQAAQIVLLETSWVAKKVAATATKNWV